MTRFKIALSNGETIIEGVAPFEFIRGELSPVLKIKKYIKENNLKITSLSIIDGARTFNLHSASNNPKFKAFYEGERPIAFDFYRYLGGGVGKVSEKNLFIVAEAIYPKYRLQIWIDQNNPNNSWSLVK
jgi:hypothetical protein